MANMRADIRGMAPLILLLVLTAAFFLPWFNRFVGVRSGAGEFAGGMSILAGRVPYRDFFNPGPPLNALKSALLLQVFGRSLFVLRVAAVAERLLLAGMLFIWLRRFVRQRAAWIASAATIILSAGDRTDPLASYNHDAILLAMAAAMCLDLLAAARVGKHFSRSSALLLSAGALTGLCLLTKQTVGGCCLILFVLWIYLAGQRHGIRRTQTLAVYGTGVMAPVLLITAWLWHKGALKACVRMVFIQGPSAKAGSPLDFLFRTLLVAYDNAGWVVLGTFFLLLASRPLLRASRALPQAKSFPEKEDESIVLPFTLFGASILLAMLFTQTRLPTLHDQSKSAVYFTLFSLSLVALIVGKSSGPAIQKARLLLFVGTGVAVAFSLSLSWPAFEAMLLPGVALPLALVLDACGKQAGKWVVVLLAFAVFLQLREKLDLPFGFDYQVEAPVADARVASVQPLLQGMRLPLETVRFLDGTTKLVHNCVGAGETVFTYPEMGLIYALSGASPPTLSPSHNIDVVNDSFARQEAFRLAANPPRVLVYYPETEADAEGAERLWRHGRPSGQREIAATVERLLPRYQLVERYHFRKENPEIGLYLLRTDKPASWGCR